jgi:uncharacterized protein YndB with AHSA1/START domain
MENFNWTTFTCRIPVNCSPQQAHDAWVTQEAIESWFLRESIYSKSEGTALDKNSPVIAGDKYRWRWHGYDDEVTEYGDILENNGKDRFKFTFAFTCTVTVEVKTVNGITVVYLTQENIPTDEKAKVDYHLGCKTGWTFYLANLKSILEGGVDLRNKDLMMKDMVNA